MNDLVSVIIPVFNSESFIEEALLSIINQSYKNIEIIIIDDGSSDNSLKILQYYSKLDRRIKLFSRENKGLSNTLNELISLSSGTFIARMDSDDICDINRIQVQVDFLKKNKNISALSCGFDIFYNNNTTSCSIIHPSDNNLIRFLLFFCCPICHPGVMFRSSAIKKYKYQNVYSEDHYLWCIFLLDNLVSNVEVSLIKYRRHTSSLSIKNKFFIRFSVLLNGFKFFLKQYKNVHPYSLNEIILFKNKYKNINWNIFRFYNLLLIILNAKIFK